MSTEIRIERNRFQPGQELASQVAVLEQRVVLNSSFKFPAGFVGGAQKGNLMMTSRAYEVAQRTVDKAFADFAGTLAKIQKNLTSGNITAAQATAQIGGSGIGGPYAPNSALGRLDRKMELAEAQFPYGRGISTDPVTAFKLGVGLSVGSAGNLANPAAVALAGVIGSPGSSVAEIMDTALAGSPAGAAPKIAYIRACTLQFRVDLTPGGTGLPGTMPFYLATYGPSAAPFNSFSLYNS